MKDARAVAGWWGVQNKGARGDVIIVRADGGLSFGCKLNFKLKKRNSNRSEKMLQSRKHTRARAHALARASFGWFETPF
jgi:hypothetical protein